MLINEDNNQEGVYYPSDLDTPSDMLQIEEIPCTDSMSTRLIWLRLTLNKITSIGYTYAILAVIWQDTNGNQMTLSFSMDRSSMNFRFSKCYAIPYRAEAWPILTTLKNLKFMEEWDLHVTFRVIMTHMLSPAIATTLPLHNYAWDPMYYCRCLSTNYYQWCRLKLALDTHGKIHHAYCTGSKHTYMAQL